MGSADITDLLQRATDAWNGHDPDGVAACYTEDADFIDVALPEPLRGRAAIRDAAAGYMAAFSDLRLEVGEPMISGGRVAQEWTATGTHDGDLMGMPATGRRVTVHGCGVDELGEDGLFRRGANYWNVASLMQQLGVMPEAAGTGS
jgi:steroid delta-isomerase-like uncharacterized protein